MIKMEGITKIYKNYDVEIPALKNITLNIEDGEYISIVGSSGSGKSTFLNILGGMDTATSGKYFYNDKPIHELKGKQLHRFRRNNVSFVFQYFALMNQYSVYENVEIPLLAKGIGKAERKKIILEQLESLNILDIKDKLPVHISGGQQQRCAIARALVSGNQLILADEPTGALDKETGLEVMRLLKEVNKKGKTMMIVTHDTDIANMADRIIRIEDGMLC